MRSQRQPSNGRWHSDFEYWDKDGCVEIRLLSSARCSRTAVSSQDGEFKCLGEGDVETGD